jgi:hypothetical protein
LLLCFKIISIYSIQSKLKTLVVIVPQQKKSPYQGDFLF